jgi:homoserine kinase
MTKGLEGIEIVVPGSTSNLGSGFDAFGLALDVPLTVRIVEVDHGQPGRLVWRFVGPAPDGENFIERGFRAGIVEPLGSPSLVVEARTAIPMKSGLGSSAAAIVAGLRLAACVDGAAGRQSLLDRATALEGHPDNVSASILGGLTLSCTGTDGHVVSRAAHWPTAWLLVVATPEIGLATKDARAVLPESVSRAAAVANLQRAALLVHAVDRVDRDAMREALRDRLHQPYRARLVPGLERALAFRAPSLIGVFLSGAGPSIAAIVDDDPGGVVEMFRRLYDDLGLRAEVRVIPVRQPLEVE